MHCSLLAGFVGCLAIGGFLTSAACSVCTEIGCQDEVRVSFGSELDVDQTAVLRACLNDDCVEVHQRPLPQRCESASNGSVRLEWCALEDGSVAVLYPAKAVLRDGDIVSLHTEDAQANVLLDRQESVSYRDTFPNGSDCPPRCRTASLTL